MNDAAYKRLLNHRRIVKGPAGRLHRRHAGVLAERVRELGQWLAAEDEPDLTKSFDLWIGALGQKWGVELPSIRDYEEASAVLLEKIDRWEAEIRQAGVSKDNRKAS